MGLGADGSRVPVSCSRQCWPNTGLKRLEAATRCQWKVSIGAAGIAHFPGGVEGGVQT